MRRLFLIGALLIAVAAVLAAGLHISVPKEEGESTVPAAISVATARPTASSPQPLAEPSASAHGSPPPADPFDAISLESLLAYLEDLTAIQPYSGWRNSASTGEAEALDYVAATLADLDRLNEAGLELERQHFRVFLGTELREASLQLTMDGQATAVPANGLRGPRDDAARATNFDSDRGLGDADRNPIVVEGPVRPVRSSAEIEVLKKGELEGRLAVVDYGLVDGIVQGGSARALQLASTLLAARPAGLVLVTSFSNEPGESHGAFVGEGGVFDQVEAGTLPPTLYVRLEDLVGAGIAGWDGLERIESARLAWDADVLLPATSGNVVAHIPGTDPSRAVILSAHIDSPNSPGALDDGSGSAILLEIARILDATGIQPPTDLYLVWFGSEELGLYGSAHFVATHQELLDRTTAMLQIDCLTRPLDGIDGALTLVTWGNAAMGDSRLPWPDHLVGAAARHGTGLITVDTPTLYSDNSSFAGFDVPQADLIYVNETAMEATGSLHYAAHIHDPYDTVALAREMGDILMEMARVALTAAVEPPAEPAALRVTPRPDRRVVFVASHTEPVQMTPVGFVGLDMTFAWAGFDVDMIPYGREVTTSDLEGADLVFVLPAVDYPDSSAEPAPYDEEWSETEAGALEAYVSSGGLLVLTNSAHRLKYGGLKLEPNEDWSDANTLAALFGISYRGGTLAPGPVQVTGNYPLLQGVMTLDLIESNGVPFEITDGEVLAKASEQVVAALVEHGRGRILILADIGMLGGVWGGSDTLRFWQNLAEYARQQSRGLSAPRLAEPYGEDWSDGAPRTKGRSLRPGPLQEPGTARQRAALPRPTCTRLHSRCARSSCTG